MESIEWTYLYIQGDLIVINKYIGKKVQKIKKCLINY